VAVRVFDEVAFKRAFAEMAGIRWQEEPEYYPRYQTRYAAILRRFAEEARERRLDVLDIGGGQLAFLAVALWADRGCVADIDDGCFAALRAKGIDAFQWDLALEDPPTDRRFDAIFFSEVIEHLPLPGHIALRRLRTLMRSGGLLFCSTPNLYRLRNIVYLIRGRPLFDHFDLPGERGYGHVLEYSAEHLDWQLERAGFVNYVVELHDFTHVPHERLARLLAAVGAPLRRIPRYRDNLLAVATAP
jgi:2-polyprenyl-3-methyl-5-hydroxy-6-metoxy-1,4-benzoquinol methylase